jgi:hypothetical protein
MDEKEKSWWAQNKQIVYSLSPYNYINLLIEGRGLFGWSNKRFGFLKQWWWNKFKNDWWDKFQKTSSGQDKLF